MSLTLFDISELTDSRTKEMLLKKSRILFDQKCVINEPGAMEFFNIFWITKGRARVTIDFTGFDVEANTLFFLLPGQVFTVLSVEDLAGYRLSFARDFYFICTQHPEIGCAGILFNTYEFGPTIQLKKEEVIELENSILSIQEAINSKGLARAEMVQSYLKIFLIQCAQAKRRQLDSSEKNEFRSLEELNEFNRILEHRFREWHSVKDYADSLHISPKSLTKKLSKYGQSPSRLIYDRIILEAKRMIYYSKKSVKEIAVELGFDDPYHFSKFFKTHTSVSPKQFSESVPLQ